jgi:poly-gamma-glutamate capsule biosynthesis protein CapA/YwtB (metallophosphatase superfamily)
MPRAGLSDKLSNLFAKSGLNPELEKELLKESGLIGFKSRLEKAGMEYQSDMISSHLKELVHSADFVCANLECALSNRGSAIENKKYKLRAAPYYLSVLKRLNINIVCLANNHILDYGSEALDDTIKYLQKADILYCGLQKKNDNNQQPLIIEKGRNKIAILNYVEPNIIDPSPDIYLEHKIHPCPLNPKSVIEDIQAIKSEIPVVVVLHWGEEWNFLAREDQREFARQLINNGAAAVIGHHPHLAGEVENYRNGLIVYSLGNLFMMLPPFSGDRAKHRFVTRLEFENNILRNYELIPITDDISNLPQIDKNLNINSLYDSFLPEKIKKAEKIIFDSFSDLKNAQVSTDCESGVWDDNYLDNKDVVQGKIPLGPGWRFENNKWSGTVLSREFKTDSFLNLNITHLYDDLYIKNVFNIMGITSKVHIIIGYPEYFEPLENFKCPEFELYLNDKKIYSLHRLDKTINWIEETIDVKNLKSENELLVEVIGKKGQYGYICWRIWGVK